jgi:hypothetical protein
MAEPHVGGVGRGDTLEQLDLILGGLRVVFGGLDHFQRDVPIESDTCTGRDGVYAAARGESIHNII